jgi:hypothetical protein
VKSGMTYRSNNDSAFKAVVLNLRAVNPEVATKWLGGVRQSMYIRQMNVEPDLRLKITSLQPQFQCLNKTASSISLNVLV